MEPIHFNQCAKEGLFQGLNEINDSFVLSGIDIILLNKILICVLLNKNFIENDHWVSVYIDVDQIYQKVGEILEELKNADFRILNIDSTYNNFRLDLEKYNINYTIYGLHRNRRSMRRMNQIYPLIYFNQLQTISINEREYKIPLSAEKMLKHLFNDWKTQIGKKDFDTIIEKKITKHSLFKVKLANAFTTIKSISQILKNKIINDHREPLFIRMLDSAICEDLSIIEVGSSDGRETDFILKKHPDKNLSVYVVEPDKENIEKVKKRNKCHHQIKYYNLGMSNKNETSHFYKSNDRPNLNSAIPNRFSSEKIKVKYTTLDKFIKENQITAPLLIKMDIEGFEVEVLEGFLEYAKDHGNIKILMEVHPNTYSKKHSLRRILEQMIEYGFRFKFIESAGNPRPKLFEEKGYRPFKIAKYRGLYKDINQDFAFNVISKNISDKMKDPSRLTLKIVRSVLLEKI